MLHPARKMIEGLHERGACPRIHVDLTAEGVVCPDFLREKWGEELVIDLDPSYPLNLVFTDDAVEADLSFGGYVTRCTFPFASIYVAADRETGKGIVLEQNMPESVRRKRQPAPAPAPEASERAQGKPERPKAGGSRRRRRPKPEAEPKPQLQAAPEPGLASVPDPEPEPESPTPKGPALVAEEPEKKPAEEPDAAESSEDEAQRRRAVFSVIDGDG